MRYLCFILLFISGTVSVSQDPYFPPAGSWEERMDEGFVPDKLHAAIEFALSNEYSGSRDLRMAILRSFAREPYHEIKGPVKRRGGPAGLIIKNGYIVASWGDPSRVDMTFSVTKSYLSTVVSIALRDSLIRDIHDPVAGYVWDGSFEGEHNSKITWHHLLNQSSDWSGELFGMYDWADRPPREGGVDDWRSRELNDPGTSFKYNDVRVNLLAYSTLQVLRKPLPEILKEEIMNPIGASTTWRWFGYDHAWITMDGAKIQSVTGGGHSGGGMFVNTYDQARFGLLFGRAGNWNGERLVSSDWIESARTPSEARPDYGYLWWLNSTGTLEGIPDHVYYAAGFGGNYIIIDDQRDLVIVTRWLEPSTLSEFTGMIYDALE